MLSLLPSKDNFNPRTSCEVRPSNGREKTYTITISIHAPLARCDINEVKGAIGAYIFQSTHLLRGATEYHGRAQQQQCISIHAPLARCDRSNYRLDFRNKTFQSTHLLRGATLTVAAASGLGVHISIHAPLARCDISGTGMSRGW